YPDQQALDARAALLGNPSAVLMTGPAFGRDHYTLWAAVANELFLYVLLAGAIMSILLTVRHTRAEEEAGRLEVLRRLPTGRRRPGRGGGGEPRPRRCREPRCAEHRCAGSRRDRPGARDRADRTGVLRDRRRRCPADRARRHRFRLLPRRPRGDLPGARRGR